MRASRLPQACKAPWSASPPGAPRPVHCRFRIPARPGVTSETPFTVSTQPGSFAALLSSCNSSQVRSKIQTNIIQLASGVLGAPVAFSNPNPLTIPPGARRGLLAGKRLGHLLRRQSHRSLYLADLTDEDVIVSSSVPTAPRHSCGQQRSLGANYGAACSPAADRTISTTSLLNQSSRASLLLSGLSPRCNHCPPSISQRH